ncbi:hypothetical protein LLG96_19610 [bacterium]|nr:hypothetical protein [bacterium]
METHKIEAHKITRPIQLMAVWFIALLLIDTTFLTAAAKINSPTWIASTLVISAIIFVPLFLTGVFLMQTVFRKELQDDPFYSEWLKRQEETFKNFVPENVSVAGKINVNVSEPIKVTTVRDIRIGEDDLEKKRKKSYEEKKGLFLVHSWRPSITPGQVADIVIWLQQHGEGPLSKGIIDKVEYQLGPKFFKHPMIKTNQCDSFRLEVSAYGPMLCLARVYIEGEKEPLLLERYINF